MYQQAQYHPGLLGGGRYEVRGLLGRGGMAEVRDGWDVKLSRPVAIKLLNPGFGARPESRLRFETEARAAARLTSRHVVVVHDVGEDDGLPFIVMERLPGVSFADHIARGPLPLAFVQAVLDSVLDALIEAHSAGILHRDVKPGNILFTATGEPKLSDFGIAKTAGAAYTRAGEVVGSMPYMSPERLTSAPATPADDLYAIGVVGYEALTGRRPFPQEHLGALARAILHDAPPPIAAFAPMCHRAWPPHWNGRWRVTRRSGLTTPTRCEPSWPAHRPHRVRPAPESWRPRCLPRRPTRRSAAEQSRPLRAANCGPPRSFPY